MGIIGTLVVMYTRASAPAVRLLPDDRAGRLRRVDVQRQVRPRPADQLGEQEKQRRTYLRQLDEDRDEVQRAAQQQRRSQLYVHGDPHELDTIIGGPRMWGAPPGDPTSSTSGWGIGVQSTADSAVSLQWPDVPGRRELEPVTGRALRDFILEQSKIRDIGKVLSLRSRPGIQRRGDSVEDLHAVARSVLCALAVYHSPNDLKLMVVTRDPEKWSWLVWLPHNQHDEMFDACGLRRLVFTSPGELEEALDGELHRKGVVRGRHPAGPVPPPCCRRQRLIPPPLSVRTGSSSTTTWALPNSGKVTGQKGMAESPPLRLGNPAQRRRRTPPRKSMTQPDGRLRHRDSFYAVADMLGRQHG